MSMQKAGKPRHPLHFSSVPVELKIEDLQSVLNGHSGRRAEVCFYVIGYCPIGPNCPRPRCGESRDDLLLPFRRNLERSCWKDSACCVLSALARKVPLNSGQHCVDTAKYDVPYDDKLPDS